MRVTACPYCHVGQQRCRHVDDTAAARSNGSRGRRRNGTPGRDECFDAYCTGLYCCTHTVENEYDDDGSNQTCERNTWNDDDNDNDEGDVDPLDDIDWAHVRHTCAYAANQCAHALARAGRFTVGRLCAAGRSLTLLARPAGCLVGAAVGLRIATRIMGAHMDLVLNRHPTWHQFVVVVGVNACIASALRIASAKTRRRHRTLSTSLRMLSDIVGISLLLRASHTTLYSFIERIGQTAWHISDCPNFTNKSSATAMLACTSYTMGLADGMTMGVSAVAALAIGVSVAWHATGLVSHMMRHMSRHRAHPARRPNALSFVEPACVAPLQQDQPQPQQQSNSAPDLLLDSPAS